MREYLMDMHVHTSEVSPCGCVAAADMVRMYKESKYDGVVVTDHYYDGYFNCLGELDWHEKADAYLRGYETALAEGKLLGLKVLLGIELRFVNNPNDYLVYGITRALLHAYPALYTMTPESFKPFAAEHGLLVYQAHAYRAGLTVEKPEFLDGMETCNGNPRHDSHNDLALAYALKHKLLRVSGSDFHQTMDLARSGIVLPSLPEHEAALVALLKDDGILRHLEPGRE